MTDIVSLFHLLKFNKAGYNSIKTQSLKMNSEMRQT
uniref:Uncharacterized protein n=1 Tax=Anguilla anguilla TaxID=7936 RepID=A0A0E9SYA6_ANGAN